MKQDMLVVLDLGLPDMDGGEFIRQVRLFSTVPIIVLSARTEENDKVSALDLGANDYITKHIVCKCFCYGSLADGKHIAPLARGKVDAAVRSPVTKGERIKRIAKGLCHFSCHRH